MLDNAPLAANNNTNAQYGQAAKWLQVSSKCMVHG
jgi:hypothetical protein